MEKVKNVKIGDVVQFPLRQYGPRDYEWVYSAGIVEELGISKKTREKLVKVRYCYRRAGRYQLLPNQESTTWIKCKYLYQLNIEQEQRRYRELREYEKNGEQVCWSEDTALLLNHGIIREEK